jgi:glutamate-ammonia-ligase adenylyltransferase
MSFAARVTRHPIPYTPERGAEALDHLHDLAVELRPLIEGTAGCSPYLAGLIRKEAHWLSHALHEPPEDTLAALLREVADLPEDGLDTGLPSGARRF